MPLEKATIKAPGKSQKDLLVLQKTLKPYKEKESRAWINMLNALAQKDSVNKAKFDAEQKKQQRLIDSLEYVYLKKNPRSHVSLSILREKVTTQTLSANRDKFAALLKPLADSLKQTIVGKKLSEQIATAFKLARGQQSIDFVLNDTLGNPVRLSSFQGKYVLLDFWASWCVPCRFENPNVKKAFERFKDRNFTVLSVSLERPGDRQAWVDAIVKDGLPWNHVAALTKEEGENMWKLYNIQSIPMNYLIGPDGKILAVYLRGEALEKKLEEIL
ncbi:MAG: TlpA family protein disulfide reductase [Chitinophagaceae bacterium]|nr:TlpA family protein disulfide reductase [Chitinophagaceae bacterium]